MNWAVEARNLRRNFGNLCAVNDVSFQVSRAEVFGLVGPDGAGKTTILRMLCGLLDPDSGSASIMGLNVLNHPLEIRDRIGYMAQRFGLYGDLTVEENMNFYADLFGLPLDEVSPLKQRLLAMTRMAPFAARPAAKLSGGMKQKLSLMCTLLHKPEVLILDEPTNGVDPLSRRDFWLILEELVRGGLTVLVATAYLDEAERCHRVALMHQGRIVLEDSPSALRDRLPETCYAIETTQPRALQQRLTGQPGILHVALSGARLHVFTQPGPAPAAISALGLPFQQVRPTLEDVFINEIARRHT
jgi:ABC-2 type transport system ATP-binding protein